MKKKKNHRSKRWLNEHFRDHFIRKRDINHLRSRAWFKLHEIDLKYHLFKKGMNVVDLGSAPGSWSQYAIKKIGKNGLVISCDVNFMHAIPGVFFLQGDIKNIDVFNKLLTMIKDKKIHFIMSDIAPNITGISYIDMSNIVSLFKLVIKITLKVLSNRGSFLVKIFHGNEWNFFLEQLRSFFSNITICKPSASKNCSREIFVLARGFRK
ncbi:RlmE family RNA methyltransferase [Buchnera aphidicola]|uniref:RlmE family RNA methyltransferase n=1 Tax=Buchnera aphidicola TaxID=9 RepID=UPI0031B82AD4